jgi:hypothetical protein
MYNEFVRTIKKVANALWLRIALEKVLSIGFYAVLFVGVVIILVKAGLLVVSVWDYLAVLLVGLVIGLAIGITRRPSLYQTAVFLDNALALKNRLATSLECLARKKQNDMEKLLLKEVADIQPNIKASIAYNKFNVNYIFQFSLATLGVLVLWLIPISISPAEESFNKLLGEQSAKLGSTAESIKEKGNLDAVTQSLANQMEAIAQAIKENKALPQEIIKQIEGLKTATEKEITAIEGGEKLFNQMSLIFSGDTLGSPNKVPLSPEEISKFIKDIEEAIQNGRVNVDMVNQLKEAIKQSIADMPENESLKQVASSLEKGDLSAASFSEPLQKFFRDIAAKNRQVIENIQVRLKITEREIKTGWEEFQPKTDIIAPVEPIEFSLANHQEYQIPIHQAGTQPDPIWMSSVVTDTPKERIEVIEFVIKASATALQSPTWPNQYDNVIREYFK